jgi:WD40 repeat protein
VLQWTGGQPFLTQKLCQLVLIAESSIPEGNEAEWVENLVRSHVIQNWESQDDPEHLKTIRDRILCNEQRTSRLLGLYQQILQQGEIAADNISEQMELRLSGLVVKQHGKLRVYNRIYEAVFDQSWVNQQLAKLRPYSEAIAAWLASNRQDESRLLRGEALEEALAWAEDKSLSAEDYAFLTASQQKELEAERQAKQILAEAKQKAEQLIEDARKEAEEGNRLEREGVRALRLFEDGGKEIESLLLAMAAGQALRKMVQDGRSLQEYPAISPLFALKQILDYIRVRNQFKGHIWGENTVSFSPNWEYVATASYDGKVGLWDFSGNQIAQFQTDSWDTNVIFSPDGKVLATYSKRDTVELWDLSGRQIAKFKYEDLYTIRFSPNSQLLATTSRERYSRPLLLKEKTALWSLSGEQIAEFTGGFDAFSSDGKYISTTSWEPGGTTILWDLSGNQIIEFAGSYDGFSPNGKYIATSLDTTNCDGTTILWDLSGNEVAEFAGFYGGFSPDGKYLTIHPNKHAGVGLWDLSGNQIAEFPHDEDEGFIESVIFSPNGDCIATISATTAPEAYVRLWDLAGNCINKFKGYYASYSLDGKYLAIHSDESNAWILDLSRNQISELRHQWRVWRVRFSPDCKYIATDTACAPYQDTTWLWDLSNKKIDPFKGHQGKVLSVTFNPSGEYLSTASDDGTAMLWDLSGKQIVEFKGHQKAVRSVNFTPNGECLATASDDGTAMLWDLSGKQIVEFRGHQKAVRSISFSPNGECLATASDDHRARLWGVSGKQIAEFRVLGTSVSFSPNGEYLALSDYSSVTLWDLSGKQIAEFKVHGGEVLSISFSPNGEYIATASDDGIPRVWDLSGKTISQFWEHQGKVLSVSFSPDGQILATASDDGTASLWSLSARLLAEFKGHQGRVNSVSFSPDGKYLATASDDRTARLWRVETLDELLARGCDWLKYYLASHPEAREKLKVCQN